MTVRGLIRYLADLPEGWLDQEVVLAREGDGGAMKPGRPLKTILVSRDDRRIYLTGVDVRDNS